jgi:hypothetical protein
MPDFDTGDFAKVSTPAPLLNIPDFRSAFGGKDQTSLLLDQDALFRPLEIILLAESKVKITARFPHHIVAVATSEYRGDPLYIDARFLERAEDHAPERFKKIPSMQKIVDALHACIGLPYLWGGNWSRGVPEMLEFYPPKKSIDAKLEQAWRLQGVDCSGLLYQACLGATPRNTSELVGYGTKVAIAGKSAAAIASLIKPLDLIVWKGHVIIATDPQTCIESRPVNGVAVSNLPERLEEVIQEKTPADLWTSPNEFVIRRWHPDTRI